MGAQSRIAELGLVLPPPNKPIGNYVPFRIGGNILYLSGVGPRKPDGAMIIGKVGAGVSIEKGYEAARDCGLQLLRNMEVALGSLDRVDTILKVLGMVNAAPDFGDHPRSSTAAPISSWRSSATTAAPPAAPSAWAASPGKSRSRSKPSSS